MNTHRALVQGCLMIEKSLEQNPSALKWLAVDSTVTITFQFKVLRKHQQWKTVLLKSFLANTTVDASNILHTMWGGWIPLLPNEVYEDPRCESPWSELLGSLSLNFWRDLPTCKLGDVVILITQYLVWNIWNSPIFIELYIYNHIIFTWSVCSQWGPEHMMTQCFCWWSVCCFYFQINLNNKPLTINLIGFLRPLCKKNSCRLSKGWCAFHKQQLKSESWTTWSRGSLYILIPLPFNEYDIQYGA